MLTPSLVVANQQIRFMITVNNILKIFLPLVAFDDVYDSLVEKYPEIETIVADSAYKTPHIRKKYLQMAEYYQQHTKGHKPKREITNGGNMYMTHIMTA